MPPLLGRHRNGWAAVSLAPMVEEGATSASQHGHALEYCQRHRSSTRRRETTPGFNGESTAAVRLMRRAPCELKPLRKACRATFDEDAAATMQARRLTYLSETRCFSVACR